MLFNCFNSCIWFYSISDYLYEKVPQSPTKTSKYFLIESQLRDLFLWSRRRNFLYLYVDNGYERPWSMLSRSLSCLHTAMNSSCETHLVSGNSCVSVDNHLAGWATTCIDDLWNGYHYNILITSTIRLYPSEFWSIFANSSCKQTLFNSHFQSIQNLH